MGEVLALLRKGGVDGGAAFEVLTGSLFDGKVHKTYGGKIVESHYSPPGMTTPLAVKDLRFSPGRGGALGGGSSEDFSSRAESITLWSAPSSR